MESSFERKAYLGAVVLLSVLCFWFLGFIGLRIVVGLFVLMVTPLYLIFSALNCNELEKIAFSFFTGIALVPSLVYWLGFIIPFKLAIFTVFLALMALGAVAHKFSSSARTSTIHSK